MSAFGQRESAPETTSIKTTDEQQENIDVFESGVDLVIEAGAGTGKSTQVTMIAKNTKRHGMVIYFNAAPAADARRRLAGTNAGATTAHALARQAMRDKPYMQRMNGPKVTAKSIAEDWLGLTRWVKMQGRRPISTWKIASLGVQTVIKFCHSADEEIHGGHVPFIEGADMSVLRREVLPVAHDIWADLQKPDGFAEFQHDHYMKLWALGNPVIDADWVAVDEAQDTNACLASVIHKQDHLQRVFVGDSQQRLYAWRGTVDVMKEFPAAEVRYLTQSFRFGDAVAEEANRWLEYLEAPLRLRGLPSINSRLEYVEHPDAILCRTNADVIEQAMAAQARGMDVAVVGGTQAIHDFATAVDELRKDAKCRHPELSVFKSWGDVQSYVREEKPGGSFATSVRLIERYGTTAVKSVAARCVDPRQADFVVSTVHKVKGLEWPSVLLDSNLAPDQAMQEDMTKGDLMVAYVASTRAQEVLDVTALEPFHSRRRREAEARRPSPSSDLANSPKETS